MNDAVTSLWRLAWDVECLYTYLLHAPCHSSHVMARIAVESNGKRVMTLHLRELAIAAIASSHPEVPQVIVVTVTPPVQSLECNPRNVVLCAVNGSAIGVLLGVLLGNFSTTELCMVH